MAAVHPYAANRPNPGLSLAQRTPSNGSSFLAPSSSSTRPQMDRAGSHFGDTPVATNSALNKQASASSSLYQNCLSARDRLSRVPGFKARFFDNEELLSPSAGAAWSGTSGFGGGGGIAEDSSNPLGPQADPVSQCLNVLRLGSSLCFLFNKLGHSHQLDVNPAATLGNLKACQRGTAHFIMACKQDLGWTESDLFAVNELYYQDTNGVVKVSSILFSSLSIHLPNCFPFSQPTLGCAHGDEAARRVGVARSPAAARRETKSSTSGWTFGRKITRREGNPRQ